MLFLWGGGLLIGCQNVAEEGSGSSRRPGNTNPGNDTSGNSGASVFTLEYTDKNGDSKQKEITFSPTMPVSEITAGIEPRGQEGKKFVGWATTPNATEALPKDATLSSPTKLYPVFKDLSEDDITVVNPDPYGDDTELGNGDLPVGGGTTVTLEDILDAAKTKDPNFNPNPTKDGHTFVGWNTDPNADTPLENGTTFDGPVPLYPIFTQNPHATYTDPITNQEIPIYPAAGQTTVTFGEIKDRLPKPEFGEDGYENSDGDVFVGWGTGDTIDSIITDDSTNVIGKELKPVYDTAVVFEIYQNFERTSTKIGRTYKVAKTKVPSGGITFDEIQQNVGIVTSTLQKVGYDFHWSTKENDTLLEKTIKFTDKFSTTQNFYTAYDPYPTATNRKTTITVDDLFPNGGNSEWLKHTVDANGNSVYEYLIFTPEKLVPNDDDDKNYRVVFGKGSTLEEARARANRALSQKDENGNTNFFYSGPDGEFYDNEYASVLEIQDDGSIRVYISPVATFWMNNSGRIVAQTDGNVADTSNMYVAQ